MARTFTKDLGNHLSLGQSAFGSLLNGASSFLSVAQIRPSSYDTSTGDNAILWGSINASQVGLSMNINGLGGANVIRGTARSQSADGVQDALGTAALTTNEWHLVGALAQFPEDATRVYWDSTIGGNNIRTFGAATYTFGTPSTDDRIGRTNNAQANQQFAGDIEHVTLWRDVTLAEANTIMAALQSGTKPYDASPAPLFCMVLGYETPDVDLVGGTLTSTITGSLPFVEGPTGLPPAPPSTTRRPGRDAIVAGFFDR